MKVPAYQASFLASGSMAALGLIRNVGASEPARSSCGLRIEYRQQDAATGTDTAHSGLDSKAVTRQERLLLSIALGLLFLAVDWTGYDRFDIWLFHPKAFVDIWWHFPVAVAIIFVVTGLRADGGPRGLGL
jgi:hypothetical protein